MGLINVGLGSQVDAKILHMPQAKLRPRISVIMVSYKTGPALSEAVRSVLEDRDIYELILVDNGTTEAGRQSINQLIATDDRVKLIQGQGNIGFSKGCNYGVSFASGEYFLFLNPDAVLVPGSARRLAECGKNLAAPWIVGGLLRDVEGREQRGSRRRELNPISAFVSFTGMHKLPGLKSIHMENEPIPKTPYPVDIVSGAFMMTSRDSFEITGGFDEAFFLHVEDIDICRRTRELGGTVVFHPKASVMHYGSTSDVRRQQVEWEKLKGFIYYFKKNAQSVGGKILAYAAIPFMTLAIVGRAWYLVIRKAVRGS